MDKVPTARERWLPLLVAFSTLFALVSFIYPPAAGAAISPDAYERCLLDEANQERAAAGMGELEMAIDLVADVRDWSEWMRFNDFEHMPDSLRLEILPESWNTWGENIAMHGDTGMSDCEPIHDMWMDSPGHRDNIMNPDFQFVAIGTYVDGSGWWATQLFFDASGHPASATCDGTFCDDDGSTFEPAIESIASEGITGGCNPPLGDEYCPNDLVTRGQMAAFLARGLPLSDAGDANFKDVAGTTFESPINQIAAAGIARGCNPPANDRYCPDDPVTRGEMAAFLARALGLPDAGSANFKDVAGTTFESPINQIAAAGITKGCNPPANDRYCPDDPVTRGQMAAFLARALDL
jgi:hypothetical protein